MNSTAVLDRLIHAGPTVSQICSISGVSGASIGILHHGEVVFTENFGYRDVARKIPPTPKTIYGIASLTKSFTAACVTSILGSRDTISLDSPVEDILPEFLHKDARMTGLLSVADFLSHRSGLSGNISCALQGNSEVLLEPSELVRTVNELTLVLPFRQYWSYNNWGYAIVGAIIEKLSGKNQPSFQGDDNYAKPYSALSEGSFHPSQPKYPFKNTIFEPSGGVYSNVEDMLTYAKAVLESEKTRPSASLEYVPLLVSNQIPLDNPSHDYRFYGMGWIRTQLPGTVGLQGDNADLFDIDELPVLGCDSSPMMVYYHQGSGIGYYSALLLFPETQSAVVVLTNSMPLNHAPDWIAQVYASALFDFTHAADYIQLAKESRSRKLARCNDVLVGIEAERRDSSGPSLPLESYTGRYFNEIGNFFIDVRKHATESQKLELAFQGRETQIYELRHLYDDVFEWALTYDDSARRERYWICVSEYFKIYLSVSLGVKTKHLTWAGLPGLNPQRLTVKHVPTGDAGGISMEPKLQKSLGQLVDVESLG